MPSTHHHRERKALVLGMVYSTETKPKRGQEFRDRVRCEALETLGDYEVFSLDNKHNGMDLTECQTGKHCQTNFCDARRMVASVEEHWGYNMKFDVIILDYFFSPNGWARERWTDRFFSETIPKFASSGILKKGGSIFLPNLPGVQDAIGNFNSEISARYNITFVTDPMKNPLYKVTNDPSIEKELLRCPDNLTNSTQLKPLLNFSSQPFYQLKCFDDSFALGRTSTRSPYVPVSPRQRKVNQVSPSQSTASSQSDSTSSSGTEQVSRKRKSFASIAVPTDDAASRAARLTQRSARKLQSDFY